MTKAPADRTAKRLSVEEWFARYDGVDLVSGRTAPQEQRPQARPPADRIAVRA
ncbi:MAG TPA: hypothetical protein VEA80_10890 [Vitreimonas sp.]|uniref:hypothetical protein n=1 Tax=Vitreimonas sp. TaxID=3069702 RepID=UPI002D48CD7B|nr:hypothetical protein [Vitreimonas sp.]HYD87972.1 hypothetical protein [Vitreimonas sp.]